MVTKSESRDTFAKPFSHSTLFLFPRFLLSSCLLAVTRFLFFQTKVTRRTDSTHGQCWTIALAVTHLTHSLIGQTRPAIGRRKRWRQTPSSGRKRKKEEGRKKWRGRRQLNSWWFSKAPFWYLILFFYLSSLIKSLNRKNPHETLKTCTLDTLLFWVKRSFLVQFLRRSCRWFVSG